MTSNLLAIATGGYLTTATGGYIFGITTSGYLTGIYVPPSPAVVTVALTAVAHGKGKGVSFK